MTDPVFLSREAVDLIHQASLAEFGGAGGIRDENALESALAQPINEFLYRNSDLFQIAAAYAYHLAENQPFVDGNKRAGLLSALNFLAANGIFSHQPTDAYYDAIEISAGSPTAEEVRVRRPTSRASWPSFPWLTSVQSIGSEF